MPASLSGGRIPDTVVPIADADGDWETPGQFETTVKKGGEDHFHCSSQMCEDRPSAWEGL